jgi:hypothetical protein
MTVQPQGPKLDFFNIQMTDIAANTTLANISMLTIQQNAIVYIYEFTDDASDDLAIAVYPTAAWTTTTWQRQSTRLLVEHLLLLHQQHSLTKKLVKELKSLFY